MSILVHDHVGTFLWYTVDFRYMRSVVHGPFWYIRRSVRGPLRYITTSVYKVAFK